MNAQQVVVAGPHDVAVQPVELSDAPLGFNELIIDTEVTFISTGTELSIYTGREPRAFQPGQWCTFPFQSGYANVGVVREVGANVTRVKPGDRAFTYGKHGSVIRYNQDRLAVRVPDGVDSVTAAASRMAGVAMTAPIVADLHKAQTVAIFGLGLVGNLAGQMFGIRGCRVIGVDPVASRRALAERCGIPVTVGGSEEEVQQFILEQTGGQGADITVDAVGHSAVVRQALRATARYGQVIILGTPRTPIHGDLTEILADIHLRFITVRGALEWQVPMYPDAGNHISQYSKQETIFDWIQRGILHVDPLISHRLPPHEIKTGYEGLFRQPETYTGVALMWGLGTGD